MSQKFYYNRKHQPIYFKKGDKVLLRLHKGYSIPQPVGAIKTDKIGQRYVDLFDIIAKVGKQAYRLDILGYQRVHPVFTVAQLELQPTGADPYQRLLPDKPNLVYIEGDTTKYKLYKIESLLNKRVRARRTGQSIKYLLRQKGYGPEFNQWYNIKYLGDVAKLVQEYKDYIALSESLQRGPLLLPLLPQRPLQDLLDSNDLPPLLKSIKRLLQKPLVTKYTVAIVIPSKAIIPPPVKPSSTEYTIAVVIPPKYYLLKATESKAIESSVIAQLLSKPSIPLLIKPSTKYATIVIIPPVRAIIPPQQQRPY